jgi:CRISPR/Cas system-associated protein Cas10 (large subunit of type III CRISPR-Cas system)
MPTDKFRATATSLEGDAILRAIGKCGADALTGAGSSVTSTLNFFKNLATDPLKLWDQTKQSFYELKNFVMNMHSEVVEMYKSFSNLTSQEKSEIACTMAGYMIGKVAQGAVTGALLAKTLPTMMLAVKTAGGMLKKIAELAQKGIQLPNKSFLVREAMACAM